MNKDRRARVFSIQMQLDKCEEKKDYEFLWGELHDLLSEEETTYNNMPSGLKNSESGEESIKAQLFLQYAIENLEIIMAHFENTKDRETLKTIVKKALIFSAGD